MGSNQTMNSNKKKFTLRAFISTYMVFSFFIMMFSGIILYIAPPGRIAHWTELTIFGFTKDQWQSIHTIFTFLFIIAGSFHIYYNWKPILAYFRTKMKEQFKVRKEMILSALFSLIVFSLVLANVPPFKTVMDFGEDFSNSWSDEESEPPVPHAEEMTLIEFAQVTSTDVNEIIKNLKNNGIVNAIGNSIIKDLAVENKTTPQQIYRKVNPESQSKTTSHVAGKFGYGRKTFAEVCDELQISQEKALANASKYNLKIDLNKKLKGIASDNDILPIELIKMIKGEY